MRLDTTARDAPAIVMSRDDAESAGLRYATDDRPGIQRRRSGKGFTYLRPDGSTIRERSIVKRIRSLAIPPAWVDVWICPIAGGHIQATGRDAKGRKQYRYHPLFREARESTKYERIVTFATALPGIRATVRKHMGLPGLPREKVVATVVHLLETTLIRIGNDEYARQNRSYGLTTLRNHHVEIDGSDVHFQFVGKSGKPWRRKMRDRRVAKIIKTCQELPGQELLQYLNGDGEPQSITSGDVNAYLKEISGEDITAKDFRTWAGTVMVAIALAEFEGFDSAAQAKRNLRAAIEQVAGRLGNTPTVCRKCYVHPDVLTAYLDGTLAAGLRSGADAPPDDELNGLQREEAAVLALLQAPRNKAT